MLMLGDEVVLAQQNLVARLNELSNLVDACGDERKVGRDGLYPAIGELCKEPVWLKPAWGRRIAQVITMAAPWPLLHQIYHLRSPRIQYDVPAQLEQIAYLLY